MHTVRVTFGRACLDTRSSLDVSQQELAARVGISARYIAKIERGEANPSLRLVEAIADALGLDLQLSIRARVFPGGPRVQDAVHARCSSYVDRRLRGHGWATAREVEIIHGRSHGWIDLLAFDRRTGTLLVIEIKTRLDDLGAMERQVAWYERMAWQAARRLGWRPTRVITVVLALASDEVERVFRAHRDLMSIAFPTRARGIGDVIRGRGVAVAGRGFAMIDPAVGDAIG
jgi:transcriptional regulator with XRE-family HTH domain